MLLFPARLLPGVIVPATLCYVMDRVGLVTAFAVKIAYFDRHVGRDLDYRLYQSPLDFDDDRRTRRRELRPRSMHEVY